MSSLSRGCRWTYGYSYLLSSSFATRRQTKVVTTPFSTLQIRTQPINLWSSSSFPYSSFSSPSFFQIPFISSTYPLSNTLTIPMAVSGGDNSGNKRRFKKGPLPASSSSSSPSQVPPNRSSTSRDNQNSKTKEVSLSSQFQAIRTTSTTRSALMDTRFDEIPFCKPLQQAIRTEFRYEKMTKVQAMSIPVALNHGKDCLVKAKTGTGKTLAFLIPAYHHLYESSKHSRSNPGKMKTLIISPTRELACQIYDEGQILSKFLSFGVASSHVVYGGTNILKDISAFERTSRALSTDINAVSFPNTLVGTPGRLLDHLENTRGFAQAIAEVDTLILDEADQLLEMGFRPSILKILSFLSPTYAHHRQTLLFSATMPKDVMEIANLCLRQDFQHIDCIDASEANTHERVPQILTVHRPENQFFELYKILEESIMGCQDSNNPFKVIIFFSTARGTQLNADLFSALFELQSQAQTRTKCNRKDQRGTFNKNNNGPSLPSDVNSALEQLAQTSPLFNILRSNQILEIHSRKSQSSRTATSDRFRSGNNMVLFTSDVTARGLDYPDVTHVIQVGLPDTIEQYVHRLGRTARGASTVEGIGHLLLSDFERGFIQGKGLDEKNGDMFYITPTNNIHRRDPIMVPTTNYNNDNTIYENLDVLFKFIFQKQMNPTAVGQFYQAWLGFYNSNLKRCRWNKTQLIKQANDIAMRNCYQSQPPALLRRTVGKMGLKGQDGIRLETKENEERIRTKKSQARGGQATAQRRNKPATTAAKKNKPVMTTANKNKRKGKFM